MFRPHFRFTFMITLHTTFHMAIYSSGSLVTALKLKVKYRF
jgi:hypothetical protein